MRPRPLSEDPNPGTGDDGTESIAAVLLDLEGREVALPPRKELVERGRAALANVNYNPDSAVPPAVDDMLREGVSENTLATYEYQWGRWVWWCGVVGREHCPATKETIRFYIWSHWIASRPDGKGGSVLRGRYGQPYAPATVELAVYVVSIVHQWKGHGSPTRHPSVRTQLRGYATRWAKAGYRPDVAHAFTPEESVAMARACDLATVNGVRNAAMFRLQYDLGARASEIVGLDIGDIRWITEDRARVWIKMSKTDKDARGRAVIVEAVRDYEWDVDPLRLVRLQVDNLAASGYTSGALFRDVFPAPARKDGLMAGTIRPGRITTAAYEQVHNRVAARAGLNVDPVTKAPRHVSTHSNRRGLITAAVNAGVPAEKVAPRTGHSLASNVIHGYYQAGEQVGDDNAGTRIRQVRRPTPPPESETP